LFSAWAKGDNRKLKQLIEEFAIPKQWFIETFGAEQGPELAKLYSEQFADFEMHISRSFGMAGFFGKQVAEKKFHTREGQLFMETALDTSGEQPKPTPKPPPPSVQPIPAIQKFSTQSRLRFRDQYQDLAGWMDSFLYIDGKFRFLGRGAYPFWDAAKVRLADPCAKPGEQTGGKLVKRVEPEYPQAAKDQHVEGVVAARLTIATDGSVKEVEITEGPEALVDAARHAFAQWQYTPFMNCGKPVEMRSMEHVKFTLQ
jgi:TonB family protein